MPDDHGHDHDHEHDHDHGPRPEPAGEGAHSHRGGHGHQHGVLAARSRPELRVLAISTVGIAVVAAVELYIALASGSAAILADGLHNLGDVSTTLALALAFMLSRRAANARYPYGYHRAEDLAALFVLLVIVASAVTAGYESIDHLVHPRPLTHLAAAAAAALVGFIGNEAVAVFKTRAGKRLGSIGLIADGNHSRVDGIASLGALVAIGGASIGIKLADPIAGLVIAGIIVYVAWDTGRNVSGRLMDAVDEDLLREVERVALSVEGVLAVTGPRARWSGRQLRLELNVELDPELHLHEAHEIAEEVRHALFHERPGVASVQVHLDPADPEAHSRTAHH
jgi:cation diffusion facilitator family transporter